MKTITVLHQLLMESSLEKMLDFLSRLNIKFTITGNQDCESRYVCKLMKNGMVTYRGASGTSLKSAVCEALTNLLIIETDDFHEYMEQE